MTSQAVGTVQQAAVLKILVLESKLAALTEATSATISEGEMKIRNLDKHVKLLERQLLDRELQCQNLKVEQASLSHTINLTEKESIQRLDELRQVLATQAVSIFFKL